MYCNKCGNKVSENQMYCNKCGNLLTFNTHENIQKNFKKRSNIKVIAALILILIVILLLFNILILKNNGSNDYHFSDEISSTQDKTIQSEDNITTSSTSGKYKTAIITDNVYTGILVNDEEDAEELIVEDSVSQKQSDDYSDDIIEIENDIIEKYGITAVNLKEMDLEFAEELEEVLDNIYTNYPSIRGYLTNLTLTNLNMSESGVIALFYPTFTFGMSDTSTTRPWVIKTQIQLNAKYFLNPDRLNSTVEMSSKSGHFPANSTKYSPVAHEMGHYLSFIALLNHYSTNSILIIEDDQLQNYYNIIKDFSDGTFSKQMLDEAYQNYISDYGTIDFDEWRGQISEYALAKDDSGDYIYDETIAEAFHDVYLNEDQANEASKYIIEVLKKYLEE